MVQFTLIRHGKTDKAFSSYHRAHPLSSEGVCQALNCRIALGRPRFDLVLCSILRRSRETALIVANTSRSSLTGIPGLFYEVEDPRGVALDQAFEELGYVSLQDYLQLPEVKGNIESLAKESLDHIVTKVEEVSAENILVVGHAVLLQALGREMTGKDRPFTDRRIGECQGFQIRWNNMDERRTELIWVLV